MVDHAQVIEEFMKEDDNVKFFMHTAGPFMALTIPQTIEDVSEYTPKKLYIMAKTMDYAAKEVTKDLLEGDKGLVKYGATSTVKNILDSVDNPEEVKEKILDFVEKIGVSSTFKNIIEDMENKYRMEVFKDFFVDWNKTFPLNFLKKNDIAESFANLYLDTINFNVSKALFYKPVKIEDEETEKRYLTELTETICKNVIPNQISKKTLNSPFGKHILFISENAYIRTFINSDYEHKRMEDCEIEKLYKEEFPNLGKLE